jgi:hypothetical protein
MYQEPIHTFDFSKVEVFEAGAGLLTLLAYPGPDCEQKRADLHATLCALAVRVAYPLDSEHALRPHLMKPIYAFRTAREIERDVRTLRRRHRDRMIAGRMAVAFLQKAYGITPTAPGLDGPDIDQRPRGTRRR